MKSLEPINVRRKRLCNDKVAAILTKESLELEPIPVRRKKPTVRLRQFLPGKSGANTCEKEKSSVRTKKLCAKVAAVPT